MRHPRTTTAMIAVAIAASAGGLAGASTTGAAVSKPQARVTDAAMNAFTSVTPHVSTATLHTTRASVGGASETILVNAKGLPLYFYKGDSASKSKVTGELAGLWPPLVAKAPTANGVTGKLSVTVTSNGHQVAYKGHFLYTFVEDRAAHVTGQGVSNFFVTTPGIAAESATSSVSSAPASTTGSATQYSNSNNYGY